MATLNPLEMVGDDDRPGAGEEVMKAVSLINPAPAAVSSGDGSRGTAAEKITTAAEALLEPAALDAFVAERAKAIVASTNVRPTNFHQATYFYVLDAATSVQTKLLFLLGSYAMVTIQILAACSLVVAISKVTCGSTVNQFSENKCPAGTWCPAHPGQKKQCAGCGSICHQSPRLGTSGSICCFQTAQGGGCGVQDEDGMDNGKKCMGQSEACVAKQRADPIVQSGLARICDDEREMNFGVTHNFCFTNVSISEHGHPGCDLTANLPECPKDMDGNDDHYLVQPTMEWFAAGQYSKWLNSDDPAEREYATTWNRWFHEGLPTAPISHDYTKFRDDGSPIPHSDHECYVKSNVFTHDSMFGCNNIVWLRWQCEQYYKDPTRRLFVFDEEVITHATIASMCDDCRGKVGTEPVMLDKDSHTKSVVDRMMTWEWYMLLLASSLIALSYSAEVRDIKFTEFTVEGSLERSNPMRCDSDCGGFLPASPWHAALYVLAYMRQYVFLSALIVAVPMMIASNGGDAQTIALSSVSILFFLEVDNQVYHYGLDEDTREYLDRFGRVPLDQDQIFFLKWVKYAHVLFLPALIMGSIYFALQHGGRSVFMMPPFFMGAIAVVETMLKVMRKDVAWETRVGLLVRWFFLKFIGSGPVFMMLMILAGFFNESNRV